MRERERERGMSYSYTLIKSEYMSTAIKQGIEERKGKSNIPKNMNHKQ